MAAICRSISQGTGQFFPLSPDELRRFLGGSGLGVYLLLMHGGAALDPFSAAAPLAFVFSPLVGSPITTSAKFAVVSKSPLTHRINDSLASSGFALAGKKSGCDALLLTGRAAELSVLIVDDGRVSLESAEELAGLDCGAAQRQLRARFGEDFRFCVIGPAGERRVRYATLSHDGRHAGRGGSGAVLGSKNVKAIAVRGTQRCAWALPSELAVLAKQISEKSFGPATAKYRELGTASNLLVFNRLNALPVRNFQQGSFEGQRHWPPKRWQVAGKFALRASPVRLAANIFTRSAERARLADAYAWSMKTCLHSDLCAEWMIPTPCCRPPSFATRWASTRSAPVARSLSRWNAWSGGCWMHPGCDSETAAPCCRPCG